MTDRLVTAIHAHRRARPSDRIYGAAFHVFSGETGGAIAWPSLAIATEEDLASVVEGTRFSADDLRWSPADWSLQLDPTSEDEGWAAMVEAYAAAGDDERWEKTYDRYLRTFAKAAKKARARLVAEGSVERRFIAVAMDEAWEMVPLSLSVAQLRTHFPELDEEARELSRLDGLPPDERARALADILETPARGAVSTEVAARVLTGLGEHVVDVAIERMPRSRDGWRWAKLLADVGIADPAVIGALAGMLGGRRRSEPDLAWAAAALSRLGRLDIVLAERSRLPRAVLRRALAAPLTSFRDQAVVHLPLDYAPLASALAEEESLAAEMLEELSPGSGYCRIDPGEADTARAALDSPFEVIRRHAAIVLADLAP